MKNRKAEELDFTGCIAATTGSVPKTNGAAVKSAAAVASTNNMPPPPPKTELKSYTNNMPPPPPKTEPKYRNDQNVLTAEPTQFKLISIADLAVS